MATLFISEQKVKENSVVNENVDLKRITPTIIDVQKFEILPILGTGLYDELVSEIIAGTLTALNITLLDSYIQPTMQQFLKAELPYELTYQYTNKGLNTTSSDNAQPVLLADINQLSDRYKQKAQVLAQRLSDYLTENSTSYPLYCNPGDGVDTIHPDSDNFETNMVL